MISFTDPDEQHMFGIPLVPKEAPKPGLTFAKLMKVKKMFEDSEKEQYLKQAKCEHIFDHHPYHSGWLYCLKCGVNIPPVE